VQAIEAMVREVGDPIATEFNRMLAETKLGMDLEEALLRLARRTHNRDLAWAVMAIKVQREVGGNLAEVLESTVAAIREREMLRGHVRSLSAEGRLSAYILVGLPVIAAGIMFLARREYVAVLFTDPRGVLLLLIALVLLAVGAFWASRVVRVEV
jgi:tight adherence protein B